VGRRQASAGDLTPVPAAVAVVPVPLSMQSPPVAPQPAAVSPVPVVAAPAAPVVTALAAEAEQPLEEEPDPGVSDDEPLRRGRRKHDRPARPPAKAATPAKPDAEPDAAGEPPPPPPEPPPVRAAKAVSRTPPPPPPPAPEPPSPSFGSLQISTSPPVKILRNGTPAGQTLSKMKANNGTLVFGGASDPKRDPFEVTVRYKIEENNVVTYTVDSNPWAIIRKNGIGIGKTPLAAFEGDASTVLELLNPKEGLRLRITLRYSPP
jgi:hypothetical protein